LCLGVFVVHSHFRLEPDVPASRVAVDCEASPAAVAVTLEQNRRYERDPRAEVEERINPARAFIRLLCLTTAPQRWTNTKATGQ
jgi:hypothetical protein